MVRVGMRRYPRIGRSVCGAALLLIAGVLTACNPATLGATTDGPEVDTLDKVRSLDLTPTQPQRVMGSTNIGSGQRTQAAEYEGTEVTAVATDQRPLPAATSNGFDLNFENTPIGTVAKVVLGDIMGVGYTIDPRVQGTVSLVSVKPVPKTDIIFVLESALRLSGIVLVRDGASYRLTPLGDAIGSGRVDAEASNPEPGFGVSVVPLQYVSASTVLKLMDSFATKAGAVRADSARNLLLIQGTGAERRNAVDTALSFDVDWMRGQSVGIYPVSNGNPTQMIQELEKIVDSGENGLSQNIIKFQPIMRLNAIMVVSRKPEMLHTAAAWIKRLDRADTARNSVHVYRVKYGDARQMARVLTNMFIGSGSSQLDSADNQLAPGSNSSSSSVLDRLSANPNSNSSSSSSSSSSSGFGSRSGSGGSSSGFGQSSLGSNSQSGGANSGALDNKFGADGSSGGNAGGANQPLMQDVRITPDTVNNSLLIYANQSNYRIIEATLIQIDQPQLQVAIEATIAEVTLTNELTYGVQTYLTSHNLGLKPNKGSILNTQTSAAAAGTATNAFISRAFPGFNFLIGSETNPSVILDALHSITSVKILSNPSLVVINNQAATLQVGDQIPISTGTANVLTSTNTVVNTTDYRDTGIILRVAPRISVNGTVRLDIEQEISQANPSTDPNLALTPSISERKVKSSIAVATGQTVLLAGLIKEQQSRTKNGIPLLDKLPGVLGDSFGNLDNSTTRTELIIFIRPQIIKDGSDANVIAEELRSKLRGSTGALTTDQHIGGN